MIDINKKYRTRDGQEVKFLHRVPEGYPTKYPWRGIVRNSQYTWTDHGLSDVDVSPSDSDLIEVREPREWIVRVGTEGNQVAGDGRIIAEQRAGDRLPGDSDKWEVIRVREIID